MHSVPAGIRRIVTVFALITLLIAAFGAAAASQRAAGREAAWEVPRRAERKKNPFPADRASLAAGKDVYVAECLDCHGRRGKGDGVSSRDLKSPVPDMTDPAVWKQSDGALFYKLTTGRGDMPAFDDLLNEEQRWHVLNYTRATFGRREGN